MVLCSLAHTITPTLSTNSRQGQISSRPTAAVFTGSSRLKNLSAEFSDWKSNQFHRRENPVKAVLVSRQNKPGLSLVRDHGVKIIMHALAANAFGFSLCQCTQNFRRGEVTKIQVSRQLCNCVCR